MLYVHMSCTVEFFRMSTSFTLATYNSQLSSDLPLFLLGASKEKKTKQNKSPLHSFKLAGVWGL